MSVRYNLTSQEMDFPQVQAALKEYFPDADQAQHVLHTLLPELAKFACRDDCEVWGFLANIGPTKIAEMSGLDASASQWLKDRAKRQQTGEIIPTDAAGILQYLLLKEGFEVISVHVPFVDLRECFVSSDTVA